VLPTSPADLANLLGTSPDSLLPAGLERYRNQVFDSARGIWNVELARTLARHDSKAEARVRMWLGIVAWKLSDYQTAKAEGEASVRLKRKLGMDDELSRSFNSLGLIAWNEGRYADALAFYDSAIAAAERNDDAAGVARAASNIPLVKVELGRFDQARTDFSRALEANRIAADTRTQGHLLANLGMLEIRLGNPKKGIEFLEQARALYGDREVSEQANALGQLATAWMALGDLQRAIGAADSALRLARSEGLQQEVASNLEVLAELEMRAGNHRIALATLQAADSMDAALGLRIERGMNMRRSAMILTDLGETAPALQMSMKAATEHRQAGALNELVFDRLMLATLLFKSGRKEAAFAQLDSSDREARSTKNPAAINEALLVSASLNNESGTPRESLEKLGRITDTLDWRAADLRSTALFKLGRYDGARGEAKRAVDLVERERASLGFGPLRSTYLTSRSLPFSHLVAADLMLHDTSAAFEAAAALPGRALAERLSGIDEGEGRVASIARTEKLLVRAQDLERTLSQARADDASREQLDALDLELSRTRSAYENSLAQNATVPRLAMLGRSSFSLRNIQSRLEQNQALVLYLTGEDRLDIFVVRSNRVLHRSSPIASHELVRRVRIAREAVQRSRSNNVTTTFGDLYRILIEPVENTLLGASDLVVVPHGPLSVLPFAALWDRKSGRYLVETRSITYTPTVAAIGVASASPPTSSIAVFAPDPARLPGSKNEALAISRSSSAVPFIGRKSTKQAVRLALQQGRIVHIASHGSHNSQNPLFSRIVVEAGRSGSGSNATLAVHEIVGMSTKSPLVFLSGCETGVSSAGEGVFAAESSDASLAQAFLFAGASSVVATLWPVTDSDAASIASDFYRVLKGGKTAKEALASAQRRAIARRRSLTWAAYTVSSAGVANTR
jgi:CHAT domain-containing protein/Tfp pilus assembly protein PilF